jgi:hypothetical protein
MEVTLFKVKAKHVIIFFAEVEEIIFCVGIMFVFRFMLTNEANISVVLIGTLSRGTTI